jgi:HD-like signal output (HDOD) protein
LFARALAKLLGQSDAEDAFAAALLQDMAVPLLAKEFPSEYLKLLEARRQGERLSELERATFGWTHAEIGGQMARKWKLPDETARLIERHTSIEEAVTAQQRKPTEIAVALSSLLPTAGDPNWPERESFQTHFEQVRPKGAQSAAELLAQVDKEFGDFAPVLKIAAPARTLLECFNESQPAA